MKYTYLALGDSYTVGEQVSLTESFPYQAVQLFRKAGHSFFAPEIVAKTGETTDELINRIAFTTLLPSYDLVTLLIGVNNQYRGRSAENFRPEFVQLMKIAIAFAGNESSRVVVLSIPDWSVTPFASGKDQSAIAVAIDAYNTICKEESQRACCHYLDITTGQRKDGDSKEFVAADGLHPSGLEYAKWARGLVDMVKLRK